MAIPPNTVTIEDPYRGEYTEKLGSFSTRLASPFSAILKINVAVTTRSRQTTQWRTTTTSTEVFSYTTDTINYQTVTPQIGADVWNYVQTQVVLPESEVSIHVQTWMDNPTHPATAAGVVRLPKGSRDTAFTQGDLTSALLLQTHLNHVIMDLKNIAKY